MFLIFTSTNIPTPFLLQLIPLPFTASTSISMSKPRLMKRLTSITLTGYMSLKYSANTSAAFFQSSMLVHLSILDYQLNNFMRIIRRAQGIVQQAFLREFNVQIKKYIFNLSIGVWVNRFTCKYVDSFFDIILVGHFYSFTL